MNIEGKSLIGGGLATSQGDVFYGIDAATDENLPTAFYSATGDDVERAAQLAHEAFGVYKNISGAQRAAFLRAISGGLATAKTAIIERAQRETALPTARLEGEMGRTIGQLNLFAQLIEDGSWVEARIDHADATRVPLPKPDLRSMLRPLGPVVVFGASNFPLAFSVAGGDTASALAAGCPVIVKAHPAHPGTGELVGRVIQNAVRECGLPAGVFSLLFDSGRDVGLALVRHDLVKAVGFTGSRCGGRALMDAAAARPEPIAVYAEMGSVNPVIILPEALRERGAQIAAGLHGSITLGVGQFCTNPGLVLVPQGEAGDEFLNDLAARIAAAAAGTMLTKNICGAYQRGVQELAAAGARLRGHASAETWQAGAALFEVDVAQLLENPELADEVFGPSSLAVRYANGDDLRAALRFLEGQLTATLHATNDELAANADLISLLEDKAGRLLFGGFPTGVEVCHAMVHGGPYPATGDGRSTSVGTRAILRFARPVCYQDFPEAALPDALKEANPLGIRRLVDGSWQ